MKYLLAIFLITAPLGARTWASTSDWENIHLKVGDAIAYVGVADTPARRERGLMFVKSLPANGGMLFVFEDEQSRLFWMKNTLIPLSIGFFNSLGELVDMQEMTPADSILVKQPPTYQSAAPAMFALEMNPGWFKSKHIKKGARLHLAEPTKSKLLEQKLGGPGRSSGAAVQSSTGSGK